MDPINVVTIIVAIIASLSAYASQRSASKVSLNNNATTSRVEMEKEAYDRARSYDTETIRRQDTEIEEIRAENKELREEVKALQERIARLEKTSLLLNLEEWRKHHGDGDIPE